MKNTIISVAGFLILLAGGITGGIVGVKWYIKRKESKKS